MDLTIKPQGTSAIAEVADGAQVLNEDEAISLIQNAAAAGYSVRVELNAGGHSLNANITQAALKAAGLSSFQAAKQTAKGYINL